MGKKRNLRKEMKRRGIEGEPALVICGGRKCCERSLSRALVQDARTYAATGSACDRPGAVRIEVVKCLDICKKGPIAATYPEIKFKKRVDAERARKLIDKLARR